MTSFTPAVSILRSLALPLALSLPPSPRRTLSQPQPEDARTPAQDHAARMRDYEGVLRGEGVSKCSKGGGRVIVGEFSGALNPYVPPPPLCPLFPPSLERKTLRSEDKKREADEGSLSWTGWDGVFGMTGGAWAARRVGRRMRRLGSLSGLNSRCVSFFPLLPLASFLFLCRLKR